MPHSEFDLRMTSAPYATIWNLAWPQVVMMVFHFLIGFVDVWVAGRISREVQACMGVMSQAMFFFMVVAIALANGSVAAISQSSGAGLPRRIKRFVGLGMGLGLVTGALLLACGLYFDKRFLDLLHIPAEVMPIAEYLLKVYQLSPEYLCSLQIWQRLARAHIPEEYQFSSIEKYDWTKAYADVDALLEALVGMPDSPINQDGMYSKIRGVILLALADEAGKNFIFCNSFEWLLQATQRNPQIIFFSPYWRTILGNFKRMLHGLGNSLKN